MRYFLFNPVRVSRFNTSHCATMLGSTMSKRKQATRSLSANECGAANTHSVLSEPILSPYLCAIVCRGENRPDQRVKNRHIGRFFDLSYLYSNVFYQFINITIPYILQWLMIMRDFLAQRRLVIILKNVKK